MDPNISEFLLNRKNDWLKGKLKHSLEADKKTQLLQDADERFTLSKWLPEAANRAAQLSMVSHPSKFSHPSAKSSLIIARNSQENDGYIRSGNVEYEFDVFGNAAAMDVFKFLDLRMDDGNSVLYHLEHNTPAIKTVFNIPTMSYESLKLGFMKIKRFDTEIKTDQLIKQVYFPVDSNYHLLSILTPSGLITQVKKRIDKIKYSDESKDAKECRKRNHFHASGYSDLIELTVTSYGGLHPQNISVLNSKNSGRYYLLPCMPPKLSGRQIRLPTLDFFKSSVHASHFKESFQTLHSLIVNRVNNASNRESITNAIKYIIDQVLHRVFLVRATGVGWTSAKNYQRLPLAQRIWLDDAHLLQRQEDEQWIKDIAATFARWIVHSYEYSNKDIHIKLGDDELREIQNIVEEAISNDMEFFK